MKILFFGKRDDQFAMVAADYLKQIFPKTEVIFGARGEKLPDHVFEWEGDYIFSYLSPWIIPQRLLERAKNGGINWHPGPPEYPGIGCTNFAMYNNEDVFGITCHDMLAKVDTGQVIEVKRFPILENDTVYSITQKCYALILNSFFRMVEHISNHEPLPTSDEKWTRTPYTRKELDALSEITPDMSSDEMERRIRATTYDKPWAFVTINGRTFQLKEE